jgi:hypothetical protein
MAVRVPINDLPVVTELNATDSILVVQQGSTVKTAAVGLIITQLGSITVQNVTVTGTATVANLSLTAPLPVASGGTGATTASGARTNLGLGSMAIQNASSVAITGGAIAGATITGGSINNATVGASTPSSGAFTTLSATGGGSLTGTWSDLGTVTTVDINGGTIDSVVIGGSSAAAGTFTILTSTGAFTSVGIDDNATSVAITIDTNEYVLINQTVSSGAYPLQVNGTIYSASGGFRFPDGTTQTTAVTGSSGPSAAFVFAVAS